MYRALLVCLCALPMSSALVLPALSQEIQSVGPITIKTYTKWLPEEKLFKPSSMNPLQPRGPSPDRRRP